MTELRAGQMLDVKAASGHRAPVYGPGTFNGAVLAEPHFLSRQTFEDGITIHEHGVGGAIIATKRTHHPRGWFYKIVRGDWSEEGYTRSQREALAVAVGRLCRAVDRGEVSE